ncbi:PASTA domain-containing protein [Anaerostipes hadrus]|jgi:beta-lactam-binding protein with PASTA domain/serine/threonine protein kinase|nr:PASTA domain-containing protein [Anaerostipes hadrus]
MTQEKLQKELNQIWGNWEITKFIGEGSFGQVYQIEKEEFDYTYKAALKTISIPKSQDEVVAVLNEFGDERSVTDYYHEIVGDIVKEIVLMSKLKGNTNIVSYEDHAVIPNKDQIGWNIYIRMELLTPLFQYTKEHPLSVRDVIQLGIDMCKAIEICQKYNIIHRDIKPENIFVSDMGNYKLGDFGISRQMEKTALEFSKKGTYSYMAPEVYKGKKYNSTVDIYSLGIVLYRFLNNNRLPFLPPYPQKIRYSDRNKALIMRTSGEEIPKPCNAEGRLAEIVLKACAYDPKERYESARDMRKALESILYEQSMSEMIYPEGDILYHGLVEETLGTKTEDALALEEDQLKEEGTVCLFQDSATVAEDMTVPLMEHTGFNFDEENKNDTELEAEQEKLTEEKETEQKDENSIEENSEMEEDFGRTEVINIKPEPKIQLESEIKPEPEIKPESELNKENSANKITRNNSKNITLPWKKIAVGASIVAVLVIGIPIHSAMTKTTVPNIVNMTIKQAENKTNHNLKIIEAASVYSDKVKRGNIISQQVKAGIKLKKGEKIKVVVSKGSLVTVPSVIGMNQGDAKKTLEEHQLNMAVKAEEYSMNVKKDGIIYQSVEAGKQADEQTSIEVTVSKGIEQVKVPKVTGMKKQKAITKLKAAGFTYSVNHDYSTSVSEGKIIKQSIKAGKYVNKKKKVKIVVSLGKRPAPTTERATTQRTVPESTTRRTTTEKKTTTQRKKTPSTHVERLENSTVVN